MTTLGTTKWFKKVGLLDKRETIKKQKLKSISSEKFFGHTNKTLYYVPPGHGNTAQSLEKIR